MHADGSTASVFCTRKTDCYSLQCVECKCGICCGSTACLSVRLPVHLPHSPAVETAKHIIVLFHHHSFYFTYPRHFDAVLAILGNNRDIVTVEH